MEDQFHGTAGSVYTFMLFEGEASTTNLRQGLYLQETKGHASTPKHFPHPSLYVRRGFARFLSEPVVQALPEP